MAEEWLERLRGDLRDAYYSDPNHPSGDLSCTCYCDDLQKLISSYEERGKVLEEIGGALEWMTAIAENNPGIQLERIGNKARALRAHLNKDTPNG